MSHNSQNTTKLICWGGVGSVTGANFLLEHGSQKILIDCGLMQGSREADEKNREPFPYDPATVDTLLITHAHIDHIGRIPKLIADGFSGTIYSTPETKELAAVMFDDALKIMEYELRRYKKKLLWNKASADKAISLWKTVEYHTSFELGDCSVLFRDAGHVLGSAMITITGSESGDSITFTGDLGNSPTPLLSDTESVKGTEYLVMESVYGDRNHEPKDVRDETLKDTLIRTIKRGGTVLIPAFSLERTQVMLYQINNLVEDGHIPSVPVYLDSPLAIKVTHIYKKYKKQFNELVRQEIQGGDDIFDFPKLSIIKDNDDSKQIHKTSGAKIIIAGSGMSAGGRIQSHEKEYLGDPKNTLIMVGYQASGTLGRLIQEKVKQIKIDGVFIPVHAEIVNILGYSSHKDNSGLLQFAVDTKPSIRKIFTVMGEPKSSLHLAQQIRDEYDIEAIYPERGRVYELEM